MKSITKKISLITYLTLTAVLYIFIGFGIFDSLIVPFQYTLICCNFAFGILNVVLYFNKDKIFILAGLMCTLLADTGLVLYAYNNWQLVGMCFFLIAQIMYFLYLFYTCKNPKVNLAHIISRLTTCLITAVLLFIFNDNEVIAVSALYFVNLICNIVFAFILFKNNKLFAIGMAIFILCDIYVGLGEGAAMGILVASEGGFVYNCLLYPSLNMAWLFYIPSQALIALSLTDLIK